MGTRRGSRGSERYDPYKQLCGTHLLEHASGSSASRPWQLEGLPTGPAEWWGCSSQSKHRSELLIQGRLRYRKQRPCLQTWPAQTESSRPQIVLDSPMLSTFLVLLRL